jgi:methyltransferase (TIGR00027 family)
VVDDPTALPPVSTTAVGVAAIRAAEAARPDALFSDPFADSFLRAAGSLWSPTTVPEQQNRVAAVITWVRVRTRFLDDLLLDACAHGCRQVVTLGAGLDARAFRLAWPAGVRCFELDLHEILAFKEHVVRDAGHQATCERIVVPTDLAGDWARDLERAGFDATQPTAWVAEGLLVYLPEGTRDDVVDTLTARSAPGSRFGLTLASAERRPEPREVPPALPSQPGDYMALWQSEPPADVEEWLGSRGWNVDVFDAYERATTYGLPTTATAVTRRHARLMDATRV